MNQASNFVRGRLKLDLIASTAQYGTGIEHAHCSREMTKNEIKAVLPDWGKKTVRFTLI